MYISYAVGSGSYSYEKEYSNGDSYASQYEYYKIYNYDVFYESLKIGFIHDSNNYSEIVFNNYIFFEQYILGSLNDTEVSSLGYNYIIRFLEESNLSPTLTLGLESTNFEVDAESFDGFGFTLGVGLIYSFKHIDLTIDYKLKGHSYIRDEVDCTETYYYYYNSCSTEMTEYYQFIDILTFGLNVKF